MKKYLAAVLCVGVLMGMSVAPAQAKFKDTITMVNELEPDTLDPRRGNGISNNIVMTLIYDSLVDLDRDTPDLPGLGDRHQIGIIDRSRPLSPDPGRDLALSGYVCRDLRQGVVHDRPRKECQGEQDQQKYNRNILDDILPPLGLLQECQFLIFKYSGVKHGDVGLAVQSEFHRCLVPYTSRETQQGKDPHQYDLY